MSQERLLILRMIAEGKLSPDEGNRLLEALDGDRVSSNGKAGSAAAYQVFTRTARDVRKGLEDIGQRAADILRERQKDLRAQVDDIKRNVANASKTGSGTDRRDHTITIEVEDDEPSNTAAGTGRREEPGYDDK
jgi:polyhydroxyalkanoate synthesis regulator phasin